MSRAGTSRLPYGRIGAGRHRLRFAAFGVVAALLAGGCAKPPPPPPPVVTKVELTLVAGPDANPDARGRASPLTVRVYTLKSGNAFSSADFFSLFDKDQATLGAEMAQREEMLLRPGESKTLNMSLPADIQAIGILAAYRDLERSRWRELQPLDVGKPLAASVTFGARQMRIEPR